MAVDQEEGADKEGSGPEDPNRCSSVEDATNVNDCSAPKVAHRSQYSAHFLAEHVRIGSVSKEPVGRSAESVEVHNLADADERTTENEPPYHQLTISRVETRIIIVGKIRKHTSTSRGIKHVAHQ